MPPRPSRSGSRAPTPRTRREPRVPQDVIFGRHAVLEAARAGRVRRALLAQGAGTDARLEELRRLVPVEEVPGERLDQLAQGTHQGVLGFLRPRSHPSLRDVLAGRPTLLVALDGVEDPQNLGAILRSAEAAGADAAILPARRSAPLSATTAKASSGATELLPICQIAGLPSAVAEIKRNGVWCVALDPRGELAPWEFDLTEPVCVVVGGEGAGVHRLVRERCDARLRLPMAGRIASVNASAAAAAALYEVQRQRLAQRPRAES